MESLLSDSRQVKALLKVFQNGSLRLATAGSTPKTDILVLPRTEIEVIRGILDKHFD